MKRSVIKKTTSITFFALFILSIFLSTHLALAEQTKGQLVEIPHPDLAGLEEVVIKQISKAKSDVKVIAENPESNNKLKAITYGKLGHIYHAYDFLDAAAASYYNASILQDKVYRWHYCVAFVAQKQGDFKKALEYYKQARTFDVSSELMYLVNIRIGECYQNLNDYENAGHAYTIAHTLVPTGPTVLSRLGELNLATKNYQKAIDYLSQALVIVPGANKIHYPLAMAYRKLGKREEAKQHLAMRGMVGVQPPDPLTKKLEGLLRGFRVHILKGKSAFSANRYEEALASFQKAIAEDPARAAGWINLSATQAKLGQLEEAQKSLEKALELDAESQTAQFNLGSLLIGLGKSEEAIPYLEKFIQANPGDAKATTRLAQAYRNTKKINKAIETYKKSLNLDKSQVNAWLELIDIFETLAFYNVATDIITMGVKNLPRDKNLLAKYAYALSASPELKVRDGEKAVQIASKLFKIEKNYITARLLAMSYAENDQCDKAQELAGKAMEMAKASYQNQTVIQTLQRNLEYFQNNSPCKIPHENTGE